MKKLLSLLGSALIGFSTVSVAACSFADEKKHSIEKSVEEIVNFASLIAKISIVNSTEGVNYSYSYDYFGNKNVGDVFSKYKKKTNATVSKVWDSIFGGTAAKGSMNQSVFAQFNPNAAKTPMVPSFGDVQQYVSMLTTLLSNGFEPNVAQEVVGAMGSNLLNNAITSVVNLLKPSGDRGQILKNYKNGEKNYNLFSGIAHAFDQSNMNNQKYQNVINSSIIDLCNFLLALTKKDDNPFDEDQKPLFLDDEDNNIIENQMNSVYDKINDLIKGIVSGSKPINSQNIIVNLLGYYGAPSLIRFLGIMTNYISAFDNAHGSIVLKDQEIADANHLFSKDQTNEEYKKQVLQSTFDKADGLLNWQVIARNLDLFIGADDKNDPKGYNMKKIISIMFQPVDSDTPAYNKLLDNAVSDILSFIKTGNQTIDLALGLIPNFFRGDNKGIVSLMLGALGGTTAWDADDQFIDKIKKVVNNLTPIIPSLQPLKDWLNDPNVSAKYFKDPFATLYGSNDFISSIEKPIVQIASGAKPIFDKIAKINNVHNLITNPLGDTIRIFSSNPLPSFLYFMNKMSLTQLFNAFAGVMGIDVKNDKEIYKTVQDFDKNPNYVLYLPALSDFFGLLGVDAKTSVDKMPDPIKPEINNSSVWPDPQSITTGIFALQELISPNVANAGAQGLMNLMGLREGKDTYEPNSVFASLQNVYNDAGPAHQSVTSPNGIQAMLISIQMVIKLMDNGMRQDEKDNFAIYYADDLWNISNVIDTYTPDANNKAITKRSITFDIRYHNVKEKIDNNYKVSLISNGINGYYSTFNFSNILLLK